MQNSATNVIALTSHVESNTFYFTCLSWPVILYLSWQFLSCLSGTAVSYILVSPKSAVFATEKSNLTLALAVGSAQHCPSLVPSIFLWLHSRKMSWVTKMTLPSLFRGSLTWLCAAGGIWRRQLDPVLCDCHQDTSLRVQENFTVFS